MATFGVNNMNNQRESLRSEELRDEVRSLDLARNRAAGIRPEQAENVVLEIRHEPLHTLPNGAETVEGIGGKRKYSHAFANDSYDTARYGQHIGENFFATNYGHGVYISDVARILSTFAARNPIPGGAMYNENEVLEWREFYRENRNLFNV
jgi:hypothetical protein